MNERTHVTDGECWCNPTTEYVPPKSARSVSEMDAGDGKNTSLAVSASGYLATPQDARPDLIPFETIKAISRANDLYAAHTLMAKDFDDERIHQVAAAFIALADTVKEENGR